MSPSLSEIIETAKRVSGESIEVTIKRYLNAGHTSPNDYDLATFGDSNFTGKPVCLWADTACPYGSGNSYTAEKSTSIGPAGKGGRNIIYAGQHIVICSKGRTATPTEEHEKQIKGYAA